MSDGFDKVLERMDERIIPAMLERMHKAEEKKDAQRALIIGIGGQDGSYLADILLSRGYEVHGLVRPSSSDNLNRVRYLLDRITKIHLGDLTDTISLKNAIDESKPNVIYNVADQDNVRSSYVTPELAVQVTYGGPSRILELIKGTGIRYFQPCSSTIFEPSELPQDESSPTNPQSPYAVAKLAALNLCRHHREKHGTFVSSAILYNHDSPRRAAGYLLQEICHKVRCVEPGTQDVIVFQNPGAIVDIGFAYDYMRAVVDMMQLDGPVDLVIGNGNWISVYELVLLVAAELEIDFRRVSIVGWEQQAPTKHHIANPSRAKELINFDPKTSLIQLIKLILNGER